MVFVPAWAQTPVRILVSAEHGQYRMSLRLVLKAPIARVYAILRDYGAIKRLNPSVQKSEVIKRKGYTLLRLSLKSCVLFVCFPVTQTESMSTNRPYLLRGTIVPRLSSFRSGFSQWRLKPEGQDTKVHFVAQLIPSFYIPPILGTWILKRKLRDEMKITARHLIAWADAKAPYKP